MTNRVTALFTVPAPPPKGDWLLCSRDGKAIWLEVEEEDESETEAAQETDETDE